jgi:hypothetical protein
MNTKAQVTRSEDAVSKSEADAMPATMTGKYYIATVMIARVVATCIAVQHKVRGKTGCPRTDFVKRSNSQIQPETLASLNFGLFALLGGVAVRHTCKKDCNRH